MKRTCLQKSTYTDEQNMCEFHPEGILLKEQHFNPKDIQQVKSFKQMKISLLLITLIFATFSLFAQVDSIEPLQEQPDEIVAEPFDSISEGVEEAEPFEEFVTEETDESFSDPEKIDTVHIRIGNHAVEIISDNKNTHIDVERIDSFESRWEDWDDKEIEDEKIETINHKNHKKFNGHWGGIDFGGNQLMNTTYPTDLYPEGTPEFLTTAPEKSFEVNLNLIEYSWGFSSYIGFVTGLGFNFNDYKFKKHYTFKADENGIIQPVELTDDDFRLSKLSTTFITAPFMLEFQIPGQYDHKRIFVSAGVIGGVKIHEHTKTKIGNEKKRNNGDHSIAPLRWGYTARIGFEDFGIYATYYNTKLFEKGLGPVTTPMTIGLALAF
jgi:hypothetical protein